MIVKLSYFYLGIAIVNGKASVYGKWEFSCNGTFFEVNVTNRLNFDESKILDTILLKPTDKIRFTLTGNRYWDSLTADNLVKFEFMAWDQSDSESCGKHLFVKKTVERPSSLSASTGFITQLRKGCDGLPGTVAELDGCGVCGGDNSTCLGCDGVLNSGAVFGKVL